VFLSDFKDRLQNKQIFSRTFSEQSSSQYRRSWCLRRIYVSRIFVEIWNKRIKSSMLQKEHIYYDIPSMEWKIINNYRSNEKTEGEKNKRMGG